MAKVIAVVGLMMLLAMVAFSEATKSSDEPVEVTVKVVNECKTDVYVRIELGNAKPVLCKPFALTTIGPVDVYVKADHIFIVKVSLLNSKKKLVTADIKIDLLKLGHLVQKVECLLLDLVQDLVGDVVNCYLDGELVHVMKMD